MNRLKIYVKWMDGLRDKIKNKWKITLTYDCEYYKNPRLLNRGGDWLPRNESLINRRQETR